MVSKAVAPKGTMSCRTQGTSAHLDCEAIIWTSKLSLEAGIWPWGWNMSLRPGFGLEAGIWLWGWNLSFQACIWISRLRFQPWGWDFSLKVKIWARDISLKAEIWPSKLWGGGAKWINEPCVPQDISPFKAAAQTVNGWDLFKITKTSFTIFNNLVHHFDCKQLLPFESPLRWIQLAPLWQFLNFHLEYP